MGQGTGGVRAATGRRAWLTALLLLLLFVAAGPAAHAQAAIRGSVVSVGLGGMDGRGGLYRAGAWVPVQVRVENRSGKQFVGRLGVQQLDLDGDKTLSVGPKFILQPTEIEGRMLWAYYWPRPDDALAGIDSVLVLNEDGTEVVGTISTPEKRAGAAGISTVDENQRSMRNVLLMGGRSMGWGSYIDAWGGTEGVRFTWVRSASQVPDDPKGLDGVDVIVWHADSLKVSDLPPEFQRKAILEWVRSGGHLIISVAAQGQEFLKAGDAMAEAMPLAITGTREIRLQDLAEARVAGTDTRLANNNIPLVQAVGTLKPGARPISGGFNGIFEERPLAAAGVFGQGTLTVLTIDAGSPELEQRLGEREWILFWNRIAGWTSVQPKTAAEIEAARKKGDELVSLPPQEIRLGLDLPNSIDLTEQTGIRVLVTILFLGTYWLLAGPVGHLVLRHYKVVHWSWWVFGGTVLVATSLAGVVVLVLHMTNYDLRHRTFVLGTVGSTQVSVLGFYGVYAPASGAVELQQPAGTGGINYLAPLCMPTLDEVKGFADPQSYTLNTEESGRFSPIFRNTLKKMQGRWTGERAGLMGNATFTTDPDHPLAGELVNNTGYTLEDVVLVTFRPHPTNEGVAYLYKLPKWKAGERVDLQKSVRLDRWFGAGASVLGADKFLQEAGWRVSKPMLGYGLSGQSGYVREEKDRSDKIDARLAENLLFMLLDLRKPDQLVHQPNLDTHHTAVRGVGRWLDQTQALKAAGAMIIARAGNITEKFNRVPGPVPLKVNGRDLPGHGEVLFAWTLPVAGTAPAGASPLLDRQRNDPVPAGQGGRGNRPEVEVPPQ